MLINRDNYETIFLLYVDNELSTEERAIVEEFVNIHPDLRDELEVLQSTVIEGPDTVFVPKTQLYRNASPVESVQESLLMLLDNELSDEYKSQLLQQLSASNEMKEEWSVLRKTVLDKNERVVFPDKKSLYRHTSRVIPMKVWRVAAAILIGLGIFTGITLYNNNNKVGDGVIVQTNPGGKAVTKPDANQSMPSVVEEKDLLAADQQTVQPETMIVRPNVQVSEPRQPLVARQSPVIQEVVKEDNLKLADRQKILAKQENVIEKNTLRPSDNDDEIAVTGSPVTQEINNRLIEDSDVGQVRNTFARLAVNEDDPDRFLNIEEDKITRSKLGGIIRQVKRVVERNTKIKTSNGLRIGGFEIAIK